MRCSQLSFSLKTLVINEKLIATYAVAFLIFLAHEKYIKSESQDFDVMLIWTTCTKVNRKKDEADSNNMTVKSTLPS